MSVLMSSRLLHIFIFCCCCCSIEFRQGEREREINHCHVSFALGHKKFETVFRLNVVKKSVI